ncbi:hypothetical protein [Aeromicrobium fastidiosum]|uniref:Uncharacterized protein n=1 Tax=Aeromicrobium fastidiosum TaxID=52699 RepID=A0A641AJK1_9ACTN|nr:hypothetical protein [Aeromicrobium fastidiosum]KAA1376007.1 hypothetical protein ESP62_011145 [Aeromicrobium fastidiosum]MBP2392127.1 hypothetical protein [Aeromicrobium fastidiosum]
MHTTVTTDDAQLADRVRAADESLRKSFAALPVDDVVVEVERSLTELGIDLPASTVREWAQHISDRADYELTLP